MAAVISNGGGYYSTFGYLSESRRMGLRILPPDINRSEIRYTGREKTVRVGLMQLRALSQEAREVVIHERSKNGPFLSLGDFLSRAGHHIHLQDVRVLIKGGCFDSLSQGATRPDLMWQALRFFGQREERNPGLFVPSEPFFRHASYPESIMMKHEVESLGFLLSIHPLDRYRDVLSRLDYVKARDLHAHVGREVTTVGWPITGKTVHTKAGDPMKFVTFEDTTGLYETVFFPKVYHQYCHMLHAMRPYLLKGRVEEDFGVVNMTVNRVGFLDRYGKGR
jgi:error-prone DNA polymerase